MHAFIGPIRISYHNLVASKFRSFLTMLGIIIGVASVIIVMAIGSSAQLLILDQIKGAGSNLIGILPGASEEKSPPASVFGITITTLKYDDLKSITDKRNVPHILDATGYVNGVASVRNKDKSYEMSYQGVSASLPSIENSDLAKGRFFNKQEEVDLSRVVVLGADRANDLFPNQDPVGEKISIKDMSFTVIGVFEKRGTVSFSSPDTLIYIPLLTAQKLLLGIYYLHMIRLNIDDANYINQSVEDVKKTLRINHKIKDTKDDDFSVRNTAQALSILTSVTNVLKYFLTSIAAISLLVGGIGIMNIMLISVKQRIWEIGLRKAVGAKRSDIILQFLIESSFITLTGGVLGIIFGIFFSYLTAIIIKGMGYNWHFALSIQAIFVAVIIAVGIGIIFGLYPAKKAGKISPMEALRYE